MDPSARGPCGEFSLGRNQMAIICCSREVIGILARAAFELMDDELLAFRKKPFDYRLLCFFSLFSFQVSVWGSYLAPGRTRAVACVMGPRPVLPLAKLFKN